MVIKLMLVCSSPFSGPVTDSRTRTIPQRTMTEMKLGIYSTSWIFCLIFLLSMRRLSRKARMMGMGKPHSKAVDAQLEGVDKVALEIRRGHEALEVFETTHSLPRMPWKGL